MNIFQMILPGLSFGDAIGNDILAIDKLLRKNGFNTKIFTKIADPRVKNDDVEIITDIPVLSSSDVLILHFAGGDNLIDCLDNCKAKILFRYHNITPPEYFLPYDAITYRACELGRKQLKNSNHIPSACIAISEFNKRDLQENGYECPIDVNPVLIPFEDYERQPSQRIIDEYKDGWINILFVGRLSPNKHQEDVIRAFAWYKKHLNNQSRLFLVGTNLAGGYTDRLKDYVKTIDVSDVIFTGSIPFDEILAYYRIVNIFLCMSTHEGFCVPLLEAMKFKVPVIARSAAAVPDTLGDAGILLKDNDPVVAALAIDKIVKNQNLRDSIIEEQSNRLQDFSYEKISDQLMDIIRKNIGQ